MTHGPHREQIISLGRPGCRHHRAAHDGLESMTMFAEIRTQTLKVSTTAMESSDCCGRRRVMARQRPMTGSPEPGIAPTDVSLRSPTWPRIPRKFTRQSHLGFVVAPNRLFSSSGVAARVGSIPIARSIFRCLACPYVALGRARAYRLVPTVSVRLQPVFWRPNVHRRLIDSVDRPVGRVRSPWSPSATDAMRSVTTGF
jgi:hypothetical protein